LFTALLISRPLVEVVILFINPYHPDLSVFIF
jgi:hypothetical protein